MNIKNLLINEVLDKTEQLRDMDVASEDYEAGVNSITKIVDRLIEMDKHEAERAAKRREYHLAVANAEEEKLHHIIGDILTIAGILIPASVTIWGALKSWEFEREGFVTSVFGKMFINKLGPKK